MKEGNLIAQLLEEALSKEFPDLPYLEVRGSNVISHGIWIKGSLEPQDMWHNGIYQNSPYFQMSVRASSDKFVFEPFNISSDIECKTRKFTTGSYDKLLLGIIKQMKTFKRK